jgi:hypothetical protein
MCWPQIPAPAHRHPGFTPGQNFLHRRLLDPAAREFYVNWDDRSRGERVREVAASDMGDPRLRALIDELSGAGQRFPEVRRLLDALRARFPTV